MRNWKRKLEMSYYLDLFSPETYEIFSNSNQDISGFRTRQMKASQRVRVGDKLICYMTKLSRWMGILEVLSERYVQITPLFYGNNDPFVVRFRVRPIVWLSKEKAVPIRDDLVWNTLSFTRDHEKKGSDWTSIIRYSLNHISDEDGQFLENLLITQGNDGKNYPVDEAEYRKLLTQRVKGPEGEISVSIPQEAEIGKEERHDEASVRESIKMQALLAKIGEKMGFKIWLPRNDRGRVVSEWHPEAEVLLNELPLNYDLVTLNTVEQIDVLWLRRRSIIRAFEVEHTTSIYSGILRMADLLALQPNMDIKLHLVAPTNRREKVFDEIRRPVFSLLEKGPLAESCTYISYDSLRELSQSKHLSHLSVSSLRITKKSPNNLPAT
jgi:hypothetical protein